MWRSLLFPQHRWTEYEHHLFRVSALRTLCHSGRCHCFYIDQRASMIPLRRLFLTYMLSSFWCSQYYYQGSQLYTRGSWFELREDLTTFRLLGRAGFFFPLLVWVLAWFFALSSSVPQSHWVLFFRFLAPFLYFLYTPSYSPLRRSV